MAEARKRKESLKKSQNVQKKPHSWGVIHSFFSCKYNQTAVAVNRRKKKLRKKIGCSVSLCNLRESSEITQRTDQPNTTYAFNASNRSLKAPPFSEGIYLRGLSGCYECHGVSWETPRRNSALFSCSECEETFTKSDCLEFHRSLRHAVSELAAEDTSRKIIEIIFQSSWLKKRTPVCSVKRILKINNATKIITRFEEYRNSVKTKANSLNKKNSRCIADGNELLRFYCTNFSCSLGLNGSTNLCHSNPHCEVCSIIREGLIKGDELGWIKTMATSGRAHDVAAEVVGKETERAMLICRVIAGRVMRNSYGGLDKECDSVAGVAGFYSNLDELFVFDSRAILPCFVVIYSSL